MLTSETWRPTDFPSKPRTRPYHVLTGAVQVWLGLRTGENFCRPSFALTSICLFSPRLPDDIAHITRSASRPFDARDCQLAVLPAARCHCWAWLIIYTPPITVPLRVLHSPYILSTSTCSLLLLFFLLILSSYWASASLTLPYPRCLRGVPDSCLPAQPFSHLPLSAEPLAPTLPLHPPTSLFFPKQRRVISHFQAEKLAPGKRPALR